ncbi:MAG: hypothetical protein HEP71_07885 [Roseivirga sp.]|nr:hypothetical protein [Roseivirga sp.]
MSDILNISRKAPDSRAKSFDKLTGDGIRYIQRVAGNNWSDYNSHDPGITMLQGLAYGINDLAYRTSFNIEDLLAENNGKAGKQTHFFEADKILTTNPVSISDLRKVIIDVAGIKNAWLEPKTDTNFHSDGPTVFHDTDKSRLTFDQSDKAQPVSLIGLYDVLLEFEYHEAYGDLNSNFVNLPLEINNPESGLNGFKAMIAAQYPYWDDKLFPDTDLSDLSENQLSEFKQSVLLNHLQDVDVTFYRGHDKLRITLADLRYLHQDRATVQVADRISGNPMTAAEEELKQALIDTLAQLSEKYYDKVILVKNLIKKVNDRLQRHRNLCEDFINFKSLKVKELALCIKVDLKHQAVPDKVLARIFHALELFLAPSLQWTTHKELIERGIAMDEIFEGPVLDHGFLSDDQMMVSDRRRMIYISDLINVISDIPGVEFLGEIEVGLKNGRSFELYRDKDKWHVNLTGDDAEVSYFVPRLNIDHSNIRFYKSGIPLSTNRDTVNTQLQELRSTETKQTITDDSSQQAQRKGQSRNVGEYTSIQSELPLTYGIGEFGLSPSESAERKARAHQLKGYLLIFEQLLANYLAQLKNVNQLFSLDTSIKHTYFVQDLYEVPNLAPLLIDFLGEGGFTSNPEEDDPALLKSKWNSFIENAENAYLLHVQSIAEGIKENTSGESESVFLNRRNRFLDHLMARFGEQVEDYANIMHSIDSDVSGYQLIEDKALLLKDYPKISANRGKGFDYTGADKELSGLEMRIARLLGISAPGEADNRAVFQSVQNNEGQYSFLLKNQADQVVLRGVSFYDEADVLKEIKTSLENKGLESENYHKQILAEGAFYFEFSVAGKTIARSPEYSSDGERRLEQIMLCIDHLRMHEEQVLIIEHMLLRPKLMNRDKLLPVYQITDDHGNDICCPGNADPYSFIISVVLPSWPARFRNLDFRRYVEERIRLETPAHVFPKICWVTKETMTRLDDALSSWQSAMTGIDFNDELFVSDFLGRSLDTLIVNELSGLSEGENSLKDNIQAALTMLNEQLASEEATTESRKNDVFKIDRLEKMYKLLERSDRHNTLIDAMMTMRNVYPTATLYDCQDSNADNPIALNKTKLGTFKPLEDE